MQADRRRSTILTILMALLMASSFVPVARAERQPANVAQQHDEQRDERREEGRGHLHFSAAGPCFGALELTSDGMCTHGGDPIPDFISDRGGPTRVANLTPQPEGTTAVGCDGDGRSGKRVQAIYAYVAGRTNRRSSFLPSFRAWASNVDAMFQASAAETGGSRRLRWVTSDCLLNVKAVALSADAEKTFGATIGELDALGYNRPDRKYLVWFDSRRENSPICGVSTLWGDDRPSPNLNNERTGYARVDYICWDFAEMHEMMHVLGAVQTTAPNATRGLHCTDEYDQMCYPDGAGVVMRYVCAARHERLFDCNNDDYFSTAPPPGSYLATHWNSANSGWLIGSPPQPAPPPNDAFAAATNLDGLSGTIGGTNLAASAEAGEPSPTATAGNLATAWYAWTAAQDGTLLIDTCGSALDTIAAAWSGDAVNSLTLLAANDDDPSGVCGPGSRLQLDVLAGATYRLAVDGVGGAQGTFSLTWRLVPVGADLIAPLVEPAAAAIVAPQTVGSEALVHVAWPEAVDDSGIARYELQRRRGTRPWRAVTLEEPAATATDLLLRTGYRYSFRVRATDGAGNVSPWAETPAAQLALLQESAAAVSYSGFFRKAALTGAAGGYVRHASAAGRVATLTFNGRSAGFVTTLGRGRGIAEIRLDGGDWTAVDLYAPALSTRRVIWAVAAGAGPHTLEVRVTGTRNPAATGARVDIDAFLVWR